MSLHKDSRRNKNNKWKPLQFQKNSEKTNGYKKNKKK